MAFETLGINLVVKGVAQFARDIGYVASSLQRYASYIRRFDDELVSFAKRQYAEAQRNLSNLTRSVAQQQNAILRYQNSISRLDKVIRAGYTAYDAQVAIVRNLTQRLIEGENVVVQLQKETDKLLKIEDKITDLESKRSDAVDVLNQKQRDLVDTQNSVSVAQTDAAGKFQIYMKAMQNASQGVGGLSKFFSILTGEYTKNITANLGLTGALAKLAPQVAAITLGLDLLKLVLNGITFIVKLVMGALQLLWNVASRIASVFFNAAKAVGSFVLNGLKSILSFPFRIVAAGFTAIGDSIRRILEITIGMNLDRVIWGVGQKLRELSQEALDAASDFQLLQIRLRGLIQRELADSGEMSFSNSLSFAAGKAKELSYWVSNLAVKSIYNATDVANTLTLGMAYGFNQKKAQELTEAILNFSTAMGLGNDEMSRIVENFGQMKNQGKITGTELRDLARGAFVPVNSVLEQMAVNLGYDTTKMKDVRGTMQDLVTEGKVSVDEFFNAFISLVGKDFPNAMENASVSFKVVISNIHDFIDTIFGWKILTPVLDVVSKRLTDFINNFLSPEIRSLAESFGEGLGIIAKGIFAISDSVAVISPAKLFKFAIGLSRIIQLYKDVNSASTPSNIRASLFNNLLAAIKGFGIRDAQSFYNGMQTVQRGLSLIDAGKTEEGFRVLKEGIKNTLGPIWEEVIKPAIDKAWEKFKQSIIDFWETKGKPAVSTWWEGIKTSVGDFFENKLPAWWEEKGKPWLNTALTKFGDWITESDGWASTFAIKMTSKLLDFIQKEGGAGSQFVTDVGKLLGAGLMMALSIAADAITGVGKMAGQGAGEIPEGMGLPKQLDPISVAIDKINTSARAALDNSLIEFKQWAIDTFPNLQPIASTLGDIFKVIDAMVQEAGAWIDLLSATRDLFSTIAPLSGTIGINTGLILGNFDGLMQLFEARKSIIEGIAAAIRGLADAIRDAQAAIANGVAAGNKSGGTGVGQPGAGTGNPYWGGSGNIPKNQQSGGTVPGGKNGLDMIVPQGYNQDDFIVRASSGERVLIIPKFALNNNRSRGALPTSVINRIYGGSGNTFSSTTQKNFNLNVNSQRRTDDIVSQFEVMQLLAM